MAKLITSVELTDLRQKAKWVYDEMQGDAKLAEFRTRIDKGGRYLAGLRDLDPKPDDKIAAALDRLGGIESELRAFRLKYELPLRVYEALDALTKLTADKKVGLTRCVPGEATGLHNALQIRMEDLGIDLLLDLSFDGIPF